MPRRRAASFRRNRVRYVADYKHTINLPQTDFPMKADLAQREPAHARGLGRAAASTGSCASRARAAALRAARRPAVRQRRHPHRPRGQQDPQGHHGQVAHAGRLRLAVHPGLGLPRPADRAAGGEEARAPRRRSSTPRLSAPPAASSRTSRSTCSARTSSASACSATGTVRTSRWRRATRRSRCARSARSSATAISTRA